MKNGIVKWFNEYGSYGVIEMENKKSVIVRGSEISSPSVKYLNEGDRVSFDLKQMPNCSFAINVSVSC